MQLPLAGTRVWRYLPFGNLRAAKGAAVLRAECPDEIERRNDARESFAVGHDRVVIGRRQRALVAGQTRQSFAGCGSSVGPATISRPVAPSVAMTKAIALSVMECLVLICDGLH